MAKNDDRIGNINDYDSQSEEDSNIFEPIESNDCPDVLESIDDSVMRGGALTPIHSVQGSLKRKIEIMRCDQDSCEDSIRERVVGEENRMEFEGPATGQVCYTWEGDSNISTKSQTVLLLVKRGDSSLLQVAADVVMELTKTNGLTIYLAPDLAAKLKHYYKVDHDEKIKLFEPIPVPGFGGNHVEIDDEFMGTSRDYTAFNPNPDLICTLGGDGLLMHASMMFQGNCPPILSVAGGSLGFLTRFSRDEMAEAIRLSLGLQVNPEPELENNPMEIRPSYLKQFKHVMGASSLGLGNRICISMRMRLDVRVINREGIVRARFNVLNEVVIDRGSSPYLAALECFVDDLHLTRVQADGIIFATPTGSTAYSMAAGGSVVHPAVPGILITPVCPHVLSFRSMLFPDSVVLRCYVPDNARADASVAFDGRYRRTLHRGDSIHVQMSNYPVPTINRVDHSADWL
eukprot:CAMPEP_0194175848 /NCGR_PEP_ID=MMETSP0154-20130528/9855_1 /TAXON_ID=1049557 /ORGANISM="Thalassiothrix antarctica, Strain L6-D1" /LENGTH=458 /DNA_ID=CAMNT_0038889831 /DNA_START=148 /DNA_END=1520 /DNA_ORIENTATION=-